MDIQQNNKIIAEFMGAKFDNNKYSHESSEYYFEASELEYHFSWDWLMPVVDKIEGLKAVVKMARHWGTNVEDDVEDMYFCIIQPLNGDEIDVAWKESKIMAVYEAVLEYIKNN